MLTQRNIYYTMLIAAITILLISRSDVLKRDRIINYRQPSLIARTAIFSLYSCVALWFGPSMCIFRPKVLSFSLF